jgi:hypothetical protein
MGLEFQTSKEHAKAMDSNRDVQQLDMQAIEKVCAELCTKLECEKQGFNVPEGSAFSKVFGAMAAFTEGIKFTTFHFGSDNLDLFSIPLPFTIDPAQTVNTLLDYDSRAERCSYQTVQGNFPHLWQRSRDSFLIVSEDISWALMINESGGVKYWIEKPAVDLSTYSLSNPTK